MNCLAESEITEEKAGRATFRIYYKKGEDFKHYDFDAPRSVAGKHINTFNFKRCGRELMLKTCVGR